MIDPALLGARCDVCPIFLAGNKNPVPPYEIDTSKLKLIIVGEAPGRKEVSVGAPFVGPSGRLVDRMFEDAGERRMRSFTHLTNSAACRSEYDKENDIAALCCAPRLHRELNNLPANIPILAFGKTAAKAILNVRSIFMARGFVWTAKEIDSAVIAAAEKKAIKTEDPIDRLKADTLVGRAKLAGRIVFPALHPAFILRSDTWQPLLQIDVRRVVQFLRGELTLKDAPLTGEYVVVTTYAAAKRELAKLGPEIGIDIETEGVNPLTTPIRCVGIGDQKRIVIIGGAAEDSEASKAWNHKLMAPLVSAVVARSKTVLFHNGMNFDVIALERDGVVFDDPKKIQDTLIAHHTFAGHLPQRMDQVVSEFMDSVPWKVVFGRRGAEEKGIAPHQMPPRELYLYNSADVYREVRIWPAMKGNLDRERAVYEHDMALAHVAKQMQVDGFAVDRDRRIEIGRKMKNRSAALKGQMRTLTRKSDFSPSKLNDVRHALFRTFRAPILYVTKGGEPSTSSLTLEALRQQETRAGKLADLIIKWRVVSKIKSTYLDAIDFEGDRAHTAWRIFGTVSGRWSSRLQSVPRWVSPDKDGTAEDRVREIYVASPGYGLLYFDLSQSEMRAAAWLSGDVAFMKTCEGDVHAGNARILFPKAAAEIDSLKEHPDGKGKRFRDIAKNAGFGILYSAEIETIFKFLQSKGFSDVSFNSVSAMFDKIHATYSTYYKYCDANLWHCKRHGFLRTTLMQRIRWLGWNPKPGDPYNFMIQSFIADLMNIRLLTLHPRLPRGARVVAQIHDALIIEAPLGKKLRQTSELVTEIWDEPVKIPGTDRAFVMPAKQKQGDRWSCFG